MKIWQTTVMSLGAVLLMSTFAFGQTMGGAPAGPVTGPGPTTGGTPTTPGTQTIDHDVDLPVDQPPLAAPKQPPAPPPPPPPPPTPPTPDPTIYGKTLKSENGTVVYVIDISGSMGWDMGQYTAPDGSTQTGDRLDRAKAQLTMSVVSLPASFKFNMYSYDCSCYPWMTSLQPADTSHKSDAIAWISNLQPEDATGTGPAMVQALSQNSACKLFVLLTDGAPNCGAGDGYGDASCIAAHLAMIDAGNTQHAVINVFGIGATGDFRQFCVNIASQNGGSYTDVR